MVIKKKKKTGNPPPHPQTKTQQQVGNQLSSSFFLSFSWPFYALAGVGGRGCLTVSSYKMTLSVQPKMDAKDLWALSTQELKTTKQNKNNQKQRDLSTRK